MSCKTYLSYLHIFTKLFSDNNSKLLACVTGKSNTVADMRQRTGTNSSRKIVICVSRWTVKQSVSRSTPALGSARPLAGRAT